MGEKATQNLCLNNMSPYFLNADICHKSRSYGPGPSQMHFYRRFPIPYLSPLAITAMCTSSLPMRTAASTQLAALKMSLKTSRDTLIKK